MNRHLVLISNPGNPIVGNYIKTTQDAIDRWEAFFRSPIGGYWQEGEISTFGEGKPIDAGSLKRMVAQDAVRCDYSIIVFCGHGCCAADGQDAIQLPIPDVNNNNLLPVDALLGEGAPSIRRTVILDACRSLIPYTSSQLSEQKDYPSIYAIDGFQCKEYYDRLVMQAPPHVEILYSTSEHHKAYGTKTGSQYADAMSNIVGLYYPVWKGKALYDKRGQFSYSMRELQMDLISDLESRNAQTPEYRVLRKTGVSFPFVAMRLPNDRNLND